MILTKEEFDGLWLGRREELTELAIQRAQSVLCIVCREFFQKQADRETLRALERRLNFEYSALYYADRENPSPPFHFEVDGLELTPYGYAPSVHFCYDDRLC
jgi:hypothetical protein